MPDLEANETVYATPDTTETHAPRVPPEHSLRISIPQLASHANLESSLQVWAPRQATRASSAVQEHTPLKEV